MGFCFRVEGVFVVLVVVFVFFFFVGSICDSFFSGLVVLEFSLGRNLGEDNLLLGG